MTHGYYLWNESDVNLHGRSYSNGGGNVVGQVNALRNRDLHHRDACYWDFTAGVGWTNVLTNTYSHVGWTNVNWPTSAAIQRYTAC